MQNMKAFVVVAGVGLLAGNFGVTATPISANISSKCLALQAPVGDGPPDDSPPAVKDAFDRFTVLKTAFADACIAKMVDYAKTTGFVSSDKTMTTEKAVFYKKMEAVFAEAVPLKMVKPEIMAVTQIASLVMDIGTDVFGIASMLDSFGEVDPFKFEDIYPMKGATATTKVTMTVGQSTPSVVSSVESCVPITKSPGDTVSVSVEGSNMFVEMYLLSGCSDKTFKSGTTAVGTCKGPGSVSTASNPGIKFYQSMMVKPCVAPPASSVATGGVGGCSSCLFGEFENDKFTTDGFVAKGGCVADAGAMTNTDYWATQCFKCASVAADYCFSKNHTAFVPNTAGATTNSGLWWKSVDTHGNNNVPLVNVDTQYDFTYMFQLVSGDLIMAKGGVATASGGVANVQEYVKNPTYLDANHALYPR